MKNYLQANRIQLLHNYKELQEQKKVDMVMQAKGYSSSNWMTKFYPVDNHSELSWRKRLHIPIEFLLRN